MNLDKKISELGLKILPPDNIQVTMIYKGGIYFVFVYEKRGDWIEEIGQVMGFEESTIKKTIKKIYGIDLISFRTMENFALWFEKINGRPLTPKEFLDVYKKFEKNVANLKIKQL